MTPDMVSAVCLAFGILQGIYAIPEPLPPSADLLHFPGPAVCRLQLDAAERELSALHRLLDSAWSARDESVRRACLGQLRDRLGWPAYQGGCLPVAIPLR